MLFTLTGTDLRKLEILTLIYKQYIQLVLEYTSPTCIPNFQLLTITPYNRRTLYITISSTYTTPINQLRNKKQINLPTHLALRTKFTATANANSYHHCHNMLEHPPTPHSIEAIGSLEHSPTPHSI